MNCDQLVSVIIPCYNAEKYLDRCLDSVINQTYQNLEIILIDDGSIDATPEKCDFWHMKDKRIRVIHKNNNGAAAARNDALEMVQGEYILFVDSDDWIELNMVEILLNHLISRNADISLCGYQTYAEDIRYDEPCVLSAGEALKYICKGDSYFGIMCNKLYKKSVISDTRMPEFACSEDLVFNYYVFANAKSIVKCDTKLYHYFQNDESTVHGNFGVGAFDAVHAREMILDQVKNSPLEKYAVYGLIISCFVVLSGVITNSKCLDQYDYLRNYVRKYKFVIFFSGLYSKKDKLKTLILLLSKNLFNQFTQKGVH